MSVANITYKWIFGSELESLEPILAERGWSSLNDKTARALVALDSSNTLIGFHVLQLFPHAEPLWVRKDMRGSGLAEELADRMMEFLAQVGARGFMVVADSPAAIQLCEKHGMRKVNSPVYLL